MGKIGISNISMNNFQEENKKERSKKKLQLGQIYFQSHVLVSFEYSLHSHSQSSHNF